ncbi:MAG TPA: DUF1963 domain-containing protein [Pirellulales bacterium]|jgi:hypothetical protein|nr:DUF1963 domain-containing protein [Pirellulales bacterium]
MHALCQLNVTELPYRPPRLDDIEFITVFIGPNKIPSSDESNGTNWCLRAYRDLNMLVPLPPVSTGTWIEAFPMRPSAVDDDYPIHDDLPVAVPNEILGDYYDHFCNVNGFKLGGWPTLIQSEICWAPWNKHPIRPEYVFQIDSVAKAKWMWGANGVAYFGRGTTEEHLDEWAFAWQCF